MLALSEILAGRQFTRALCDLSWLSKKFSIFFFLPEVEAAAWLDTQGGVTNV
jgi:hypothetical protein